MRYGFRRRSAVVVLAVVVPATAGGSLSAASDDLPYDVVAQPATVTSLSLDSRSRSYPTTLADGTATTTSWRVTKGSGNCCENLLTTTPGGRLLDFGGTYIHFTDDGGRTWKRVLPTTPLMGGEGTVAVAPNGDVVGIGWDVYSGDHLQAFKYEAATDRWLWAEQPLHTPFYDREWVAVVPGPVLVGGVERPYAVVLRGGWPSKDVFHVSGDGLTYTEVSARFLDGARVPADTASLSAPVGPHADYGQTPVDSNVFPVGNGTVITGPDMLSPLAPVSPCPSRVYVAREDLSFACHQPAEGQAVLWHAVDSSGRLHAARREGGGVTYLTSTDGGRTVQSAPVPVPAGFRVDDVDIKANAAAGVVAIGMHARRTAPGTGQSQHLVAEYRYADGAPVFAAMHAVGQGDLVSGSDVSSTSAPRFDFSTVAILPDGRIVTSFNDSLHRSPAVAVLEPAASAAQGSEPGSAPVPEVPNAPAPALASR